MPSRTWAVVSIACATLAAAAAVAKCSVGRELPDSNRVALVVRGIAFRDCGHGGVCDAVGNEIMMACATSHMSRFVEPLEHSGVEVDILVATYDCPGRTEAWLEKYAKFGRLVTSTRPSDFAGQESQLDSLLRALRLIEVAYAGVLLTRTDLFFLTELGSSLISEKRFMFHADMTNGAVYAGLSAVENVTANTDKLFWIPNGALSCFLDAVESGECFANYDDDDAAWISGERCFPSMRRRLPREEIGFMRDDACPTTANGTFGDNLLGDGCYLVLPRALSHARNSEERRSLLAGNEIGPYATGSCVKGRWVAKAPSSPFSRKQRDDLRRRRR